MVWRPGALGLDFKASGLSALHGLGFRVWGLRVSGLGTEIHAHGRKADLKPSFKVAGKGHPNFPALHAVRLRAPIAHVIKNLGKLHEGRCGAHNSLAERLEPRPSNIP